MNKIVPLLASTALLSYAAAVAAESPDAQSNPSRTAVDEKSKQSEPAECPINKNHRRQDLLLPERSGADETPGRRLTPAPTAAQQGLLPPLVTFIEWRDV